MDRLAEHFGRLYRQLLEKVPEKQDRRKFRPHSRSKLCGDRPCGSQFVRRCGSIGRLYWWLGSRRKAAARGSFSLCSRINDRKQPSVLARIGPACVEKEDTCSRPSLWPGPVFIAFVVTWVRYRDAKRISKKDLMSGLNWPDRAAKRAGFSVCRYDSDCYGLFCDFPSFRHGSSSAACA